MNDSHDLELLIRSRIPIIVIESTEERRVVRLLKSMEAATGLALYVWSVTEGLHRLEEGYSPQRHNAKPQDVLGHIKSSGHAGIYALLDFHPYLDDPVHVRLLKDIALVASETRQTIVLLSHEVTVPPELRSFTARFDLDLPDRDAVRRIVMDVAEEWAQANNGRRVRTDAQSFQLLVQNLVGLTASEARRLAIKAVHDDGAITHDDLPAVMKAKYDLLNRQGILHYEYETEHFSNVGGLQHLKAWLDQRRHVFLEPAPEGRPSLDIPKGVLLLGVQGCGKSLAAKAVAGVWGVPLLRLDFGALYNKYHGETERNLRESLRTAEVLAPCVLWVDEIEKAVGGEDHDGGTSRRVLGTLLTWMAEKQAPVFIVATANDIQSLPPELVRKGRMDEVFFVDLPKAEVRARIFAIHLEKRGLEPQAFDLARLAQLSDGFSGAEIEQSIVSAVYAARAQGEALNDQYLSAEIGQTRPLSALMAERIAALRAWAAERTVPAD
ncbi:MAG: AAA family ATPase [Gammaproteobacteria bacterium]